MIPGVEMAHMADKCNRCGHPRPESVNHMWACCGDGPGLAGEVKQETVDCLRRRLAAAEAMLEDARKYSEQLRFKSRALAEFCKMYIAMPSDRLVSLADRVIDHVWRGQSEEVSTAQTGQKEADNERDGTCSVRCIRGLRGVEELCGQPDATVARTPGEDSGGMASGDSRSDGVILASRPSEQLCQCGHPWSDHASAHGCAARLEDKSECECVRASPSAQASKEDSASDQDVWSAAWGEAWMRRCRAAEGRVQELEAQRAEAKAELLHQEKVSETYQMTIHSLGTERDALKTKLEAAESELRSLADDSCGSFKVTSRDGRYIASRLDGFVRSCDSLRSERDHYVHEASRLGRLLEAAEAALQEANARLRVASESNDLACAKLEATAPEEQAAVQPPPKPQPHPKPARKPSAIYAELVEQRVAERETAERAGYPNLTDDEWRMWWAWGDSKPGEPGPAELARRAAKDWALLATLDAMAGGGEP